MAELNQYSRLQRTPEIIIDSMETFGVWPRPSWLKTKPADQHIGVFRITSALEGRPDLIAEEIYGSPALDWVLIAFNATYSTDKSARLALNWPRAGDIIEYPSEVIILPQLR